MAERKVLNKYYPPEFDPSKIQSYEKKFTDSICSARMMLPFTLRCYACHQYMHIGTKFNMKVQPVPNEDYLGLPIHRFIFKCTNCYNEITFKTDPKNNDYVAEYGASRNHEPWKDMILAEDEYKELKKQEMKEDVMKSLEYRTYDSKREMDILDAMDQVKNINKRKSKIDYDELIKKVIYDEDTKKKDIEEEKEKIKEIFEMKKNDNKKNDKFIDIDNLMFKNIKTNNKEINDESNKKKKNNNDDIMFLHKKIMRNKNEEKNKDKNDNSDSENSSESEKEKNFNNLNDIFKRPFNSKYKLIKNIKK